MTIRRLHHVAYRCKDAQETSDFYTKVLGLKYAMAISDDKVPSTGEESPYMHIFFQMDDGSYVAFFEVPDSPPMQFDSNNYVYTASIAVALRRLSLGTYLRRSSICSTTYSLKFHFSQ